MEKRGGVVFCLEIAVEFEEFGKERKDESKRYLRPISKVLHSSLYTEISGSPNRATGR